MDIEQLMIKAGIVLEDSFEASKWEIGDTELAEFARLVAEAEREACYQGSRGNEYETRDEEDEACAADIRKRL